MAALVCYQISFWCIHHHGGSYQVTATMQERELTRDELTKLEKVRRYLFEENITGDIGFMEYLND